MIGNASSHEKLDRAAELGMDAGINHATEDVVAGVDGADRRARRRPRLSSTSAATSFQKGLDSLAKDGRLVICGGHAGEVVEFDIIPFFRAQKSVIGSFVYTREEVAKCLELAGRGLITPLVHQTFPLDDAARPWPRWSGASTSASSSSSPSAQKEAA